MRSFKASVIFALAVLAALSAAPVSAAEAPALESPQALTGTPAPVNADCGFNLETVLPGKSGLCPAPKNAAVMPSLPALNGQAELPEFMASAAGFRTCRCSCGAPCKTDADCGPGGICGAGITCC
jgi:hypothetical protein